MTYNFCKNGTENQITEIILHISSNLPIETKGTKS
jgi:hypothetical protein